LAGIAQLNQLTLLELDSGEKYLSPEATSGIEPEVQALQQLLAQPLPLRVLRLSSHSVIPRLDLSHLNQLQVFSSSCGGWSERRLKAILPPQLQQLELDYNINSTDVAAMLELRQLRCLKFTVGCDETAPLLLLTQLSALQHLSLVYEEFMFADDAAVWPQRHSCASLC
jgi:hypothetical protein